jgi:hypothetical protein
MRHKLLLVVVGLLLALSSYANAEVFCREQNGAVFVRGECRKVETRLNAAALGLVGPLGPKGEKGERGPRGRQGTAGNPGTASPTPEPNSVGDAQTRPLWWSVWLWAGTLIVVGYYALETYKLRREAQTQTELQLRPLVIFEPGEGKDFCVRNIGKNTALNVKVETFTLFPAALAAFPWPVPFLRPDEARPLQGRTALVEGKVVADDLLFDVLRPTGEYVKSEDDTLRPTIRIEFENVTGQRYFVHERLLYGDLEILDSGPVTLPAGSTGRSARQRFQRAWQHLQPLGPKLQAVWQHLQSRRQKLQTVWQQKWRKTKGVNVRTANEEKEWVDGR